MTQSLFDSLSNTAVIPTDVSTAPTQAVATAVPSFAGPAPLTLDQFKSALPESLRKTVSQQLIDQVNKTLSEPEMYEQYRDNLLSYGKVMKDGRWTVQEYLSAVKYVSHKLMGATNIEAYSKTFPEKIVRFTAQNVQSKDIASYVTAYNKSKLVNQLMEQTMIPVHVLNQDLHQKAINNLADLMMNAGSEKVRVEASIGLIAATKTPEIKKVELDIGVKEDSSIAQLRAATMDLARQQKELMTAGVVTAQEIAHQRVVPRDVVDVVATVV